MQVYSIKYFSHYSGVTVVMTHTEILLHSHKYQKLSVHYHAMVIGHKFVVITGDSQ